MTLVNTLITIFMSVSDTTDDNQ